MNEIQIEYLLNTIHFCSESFMFNLKPLILKKDEYECKDGYCLNGWGNHSNELDAN